MSDVMGRCRLWKFPVPILEHSRLTVTLEHLRELEAATIVYPGDWTVFDRLNVITEWGGTLMSLTRHDVQLLNAMETEVRYRTMSDKSWAVKVPIGGRINEPNQRMHFEVLTNDLRKPNDFVYALGSARLPDDVMRMERSGGHPMRRRRPTYPFVPIVRPLRSEYAHILTGGSLTKFDWGKRFTVPVKLVAVPGIERGMSFSGYRAALIRHGSDSLPLVDGRLG